MATKLPAPDSARRGLQTQVEAKKRVRVFRALFKALELLGTIVSILDGLRICSVVDTTVETYPNLSFMPVATRVYHREDCWNAR